MVKSEFRVWQNQILKRANRIPSRSMMKTYILEISICTFTGFTSGTLLYFYPCKISYFTIGVLYSCMIGLYIII